jgi:nicotinamide-nucleotide amidase
MIFDTRLLVKKLREKKLKLALAESVTGGIATQRITNCRGASDILTGSIVCYTPEMKISLMNIKRKMIDEYSCESKQVTESLTLNLEKLIKADIYAAITGLASEGGSETPQKPVGTIFFSVRYKGKIHNYRSVFTGSPLKIKEAASLELFRHIFLLLK